MLVSKTKRRQIFPKSNQTTCLTQVKSHHTCLYSLGIYMCKVFRIMQNQTSLGFRFRFTAVRDIGKFSCGQCFSVPPMWKLHEECCINHSLVINTMLRESHELVSNGGVLLSGVLLGQQNNRSLNTTSLVSICNNLAMWTMNQEFD